MMFNTWVVLPQYVSRNQEAVFSIGVIGTPGCGKTTLCEQLPFPVISLTHLAQQSDNLGKIEPDGSRAMDVEKMAAEFVQPSETTLYDGHLAHYMPVDALIILRCPPSQLQTRLELRGYNSEKVKANVEVEMLGGPWNDLIDDERPKFEGLDGVLDWIYANCPAQATPENAIDWLGQP